MITEYEPMSALLGGVLIGLAAAMLLFFNGRILGVSGIIGQLFAKPLGQKGNNLLFLMGLIVGAFAHRLIAAQTDVVIEAPLGVLIIAGLLVGFGTNLGSGCTSGHGVCGIARLSVRSVVATIIFMASGMLTVYVVKHVLGGA